MAIRSGLSGVVPVDDGADEGVGAVAVGVDVEVVGVVVVVREFNAMSRARTAKRWSRL